MNHRRYGVEFCLLSLSFFHWKHPYVYMCLIKDTWVSDFLLRNGTVTSFTQTAGPISLSPSHCISSYLPHRYFIWLVIPSLRFLFVFFFIPPSLSLRLGTLKFVFLLLSLLVLWEFWVSSNMFSWPSFIKSHQSHCPFHILKNNLWSQNILECVVFRWIAVDLTVASLMEKDDSSFPSS